MNLSPSKALAHARKWERKKCKITCMIVFPEPGMSMAFNGRISVREGIIILTGYGGSSYSIPAETVTFSYVNEYLHISGLGWQCALWEPDD